MADVSFQVIDGVDKGRYFLNLQTPVTLGREEGNVVRLNDERVSRFHAKVQEDQGQVVITDLDSTNGTCVNGEPVQLRLLRPGDRISIGRSTIVFGTKEQIATEMKTDGELAGAATVVDDEPSEAVAGSQAGESSVVEAPEEIGGGGPQTPSPSSNTPAEEKTHVDDAVPEDGEGDDVDVFEREPPHLPSRLSPAQAAQLSEVIDYLHRALADAIEPVHIPPTSKEAKLPLENWQRVQAVLMMLARFSRQVAEPPEGDSQNPMDTMI